jgi:serine/threonine-protein kinase
MLTGTWPFHGKNTVEVRYSVLHDTPRPLAEVRSGGEILVTLQAILDRAMAKNPRDRYQRLEEMRDDLRRVMREYPTADEDDLHTSLPELAPVPPRHQSKQSGVTSKLRRWLRSLTGAELEPTSVPGATRERNSAFIAPSQTALPASLSVSRQIHETPLSLTSDQANKSIAILPFRNLSGDDSVAFYEFSLADAVITELARVHSLVVRPSSLVVKYQGRQVDPVEAGRELSVDAVLASSFLRVGERLRVTSQLVDVATGTMLWSDRIDAAALDLIVLQDTIARHIVDGLRVELTSEEQVGIERPATSDAAAYEEYLRGRDAMGRYIYHSLAYEDSEAAIEHFTRAIELDPDFALAHCALGGVYANRVIKGAGDKEDYAHAESAFNSALALDPKLIEARMHMVFIYLSRGEKGRARAEVERLHRETPNDVGVHFVKGTLHRLSGEYPEALRAFDRMLRLNPAERVVVSYNRARIFMYQRRFDDAMLELDHGSALEPDHPLIKTFRARVLYYKGETRRAADLLRDVLGRQPRLDGIRPLLALCLSAEGEHEAARRELQGERVQDNAAADHDVAYWLASAYAVEGEREEALRWLERAIALGNENRTWFESDPNWAAFHTDARFKQLMQQSKSA